MDKFFSCFGVNKPIVGMIHTKGISDEDVFKRAQQEIDIYLQNKVDAILVEPYFGNYRNVVQVLQYLKQLNHQICYGINCLNVDAMGFELANEYSCRFIQLDSVVGHVKPRDEATLDAFFKLYRSRCDALVMGGVRFKYQPLLSQCSLEEDLHTAMNRCDVICVTEDKTGQETSMNKITQFRSSIGSFPLMVCAGANLQNITQQLKVADGAVVGSYFKDNHQDSGDVDAQHVREFMQTVDYFRRGLKMEAAE